MKTKVTCLWGVLVILGMIQPHLLFAKPAIFESYDVQEQYSQDEGEFFLTKSLVLNNKLGDIPQEVNTSLKVELNNVIKSKNLSDDCLENIKEQRIYPLKKGIYIVEFGKEEAVWGKGYAGECGVIYIVRMSNDNEKIQILEEFPWIIKSDDSSTHNSFVGKINNEDLIIIKHTRYYYSSYSVYVVNSDTVEPLPNFNNMNIGSKSINRQKYFGKSEYSIVWPDDLYHDYEEFVSLVEKGDDISGYFTNFDAANFSNVKSVNSKQTEAEIKKALAEFFHNKFIPYIAYCQRSDGEYFLRYPSPVNTIYIEKREDKFRIIRMNNDI